MTEQVMEIVSHALTRAMDNRFNVFLAVKKACKQNGIPYSEEIEDYIIEQAEWYSELME